MWAKLASAILLLAAFPIAAEEAGFAVTSEEEAAYRLILAPAQFVKARSAAEAILSRHPDSFVALHVLARVYEWGEGNLPRAYFLAAKARAVIEQRWGHNVPQNGPWRWHARILRQLISLAEQLDREAEALELLAFYDKHYSPDLTAEYGWPLMKLGRLAEARAKMKAALQSADSEQRLAALNTWGAIEHEAENPEESYRIFKQLVDMARTSEEQMEVTYLRNLGEAALQLGRFDEAEKHFRESVRYFDGETYSNPWGDLATLYLRQARFTEAMAAVREMHAWAHANPAYLDQQSWAERQTVTAALLAEANFLTAALDLARRIVRRPDRRSGTSVHREQSEAGQLVLLWTLARCESEHLAEQASWSQLPTAIQLQARRAALGLEAWAAGRRAVALILSHGRLTPSLRFFAPHGIDLLPWLVPSLVRLVGPGLVKHEAAHLLQRKTPAGQRERPYVLLLVGECEFARGSLAEARAALEEALATLPRAEVLLQARAWALIGAIAARQGTLNVAADAYQQALQRHPGVVRLLGLGLPVRIVPSADPASRTASRLLASSPRFLAGQNGFTVEIGPAGSRHRATLLGRDGAVLAEALVPAQTDPRATAEALCAELHRQAFALPLDLSQTDVTSLQGGTLAGNTLRRQLSDILGRP